MPAGRTGGREEAAAGRYKWVVLSNTTLGMLVATINSSIALAFTPNVGSAGALELIGLRIVQGVGGPCWWPTPWPSSPTPSRSGSAAWPWGSTRWRRWPGPSWVS